MASTMTATSPVSSPLRHMVLIDSQAQQPPASSPPSAASLMSAVPLYGSTTLIGRLRAACTILATSEAVPPGPNPPSLTAPLAAYHFSILVIPHAFIKAPTGLST